MKLNRKENDWVFFIGCWPLFIYKTYRDISVRSSQVENFRQSFKLQLSQKYLSREWPFQKIPLQALKYFDRNFQAVPRCTIWMQLLYIIEKFYYCNIPKNMVWYPCCVSWDQTPQAKFVLGQKKCSRFLLSGWFCERKNLLLTLVLAQFATICTAHNGV